LPQAFGFSNLQTFKSNILAREHITLPEIELIARCATHRIPLSL